jgi:hypothetical protein
VGHADGERVGLAEAREIARCLELARGDRFAHFGRVHIGDDLFAAIDGVDARLADVKPMTL